MTIPDDLPPEQVDPGLISDAVKRAVYLEHCEKHGHQFVMADAVSAGDTPNPNNQGNWPNLEVKARDENKLPHITCSYCDTVWIVFDEPGFGYDDAVRKVRKRLGSNVNPRAFRPKPKQERILEHRERMRAERINVGKNIPVEVVKVHEYGGFVTEQAQKIPPYLQPRNR